MQDKARVPLKQRKRAEELLTLVGLGDRLHHVPGQLPAASGKRSPSRLLANQPAIPAGG
jgi:predicted ABC-type transport system involved in lysophospholipase L1 biosynthesis ATPase subunit